METLAASCSQSWAAGKPRVSRGEDAGLPDEDEVAGAWQRLRRPSGLSTLDH